MASSTKECPHCKFQIPAAATACGHCGRSIPKPNLFCALLGVIPLLFLGFALIGYFSQPKDDQPNTPIGVVVQPPSIQVHGTAANLFLVRQAEKSRKLTEALEAANSARDFALALRLLRARVRECRSALTEIDKGSYDAADKAAMRPPIAEELQWAVDGIDELVKAGAGR